MIRTALAVLLLGSTAAFASDATITAGNTLTAPPAEWLGETPHLILMGTINGRPVDVQMTDMAGAAGVAEFAGKREYQPADGGAWRYGVFEVALKATFDGVEKAIELEFENRDFGQHPLPAIFELQTEEFPEGAKAFFEVQLEWETPESTVNDEIGGWSGTLALAQDSGTADDKGLVPDGMIGGFATATLGADTIVMSFTVPVAEYELED